MKFVIKETTLTDGSKVYDVDLFANADDKCIFSCITEEDALKLFAGLEKLVKAHTVETLEEL